MKRFLAGVLTAVVVMSCFAFTGCNLLNATSSTAVTRHELIRENYSAEKEAQDDLNGREHIEIPDDAQTIEIENEEWIVLRSIEEFENIWAPALGTAIAEVNLTKNYIVANDIELKGWECSSFTLPFKGKFNGNNYKFYSAKESGGFKSCLFTVLEKALVENVIFSASDGYYIGGRNEAWSALVANGAINSTIRNCVNYFKPKDISESQDPSLSGTFVCLAINSVIENCINYADNCNSNGGIVNRANGSTISNCKNYGNLVNTFGALGGIVSYLQNDTVIENCENYGHIIGKSRLGGIAGSTYKSFQESMSYFEEGLDDAYYTENQVITNCKNYGNIYLLKGDSEKRIETTILEHYNKYKNIIFEFGGIAGSVSKVENCINEGSFYGFENMGNQIKVDYLGGVVGATKQATYCENHGVFQLQEGRTLRVGDIYGYLDN